ncbi:MAG: carboxymuconolactone decarboxylase family protein [Pseudomonadota bacterium]
MDKSLIEAMQKASEDWAKAASSWIGAMPNTMPQDMLEMFFGKTLNPNGLDAKTRLLLTLAALTVLGAQADEQIKATVRHAREAGATDQEIVETLVQMSIFAGAPAMTRAMGLARDAMADGDS